MGRLVNNGKRVIAEPIPEHAGKLLFFCEGATEYNYLKYFKTYLEKNSDSRYTDIMVLEPINTKGNARHVLQYAEDFLLDDDNIRKYALHEKHLVFDCDAPDDIQDVIKDMQSSENEYVLDYSNLLFETWLVMHFYRLETKGAIRKAKIYETMRELLQVEKYGDKEKAAAGTIGAILGNNGNIRIRHAIENAKELRKFWNNAGKSYQNNIREMNPSVGIDDTVERILDEIEYICN